MPKKGFSKITVSDELKDKLKRTAEALGLSMPDLIQLMLGEVYPDYPDPEGSGEKEERVNERFVRGLEGSQSEIKMTPSDRTCKKLRETGCAHPRGAGNSSECANHPNCPELHLAEDLQKVKVLCSMNETHERFGPVEMIYRGGVLADRDLLFVCPECENSVRIVFKSPQDEVPKAKEEKNKESEIVKCSCGETFDWENWDRETFPVPKGVMEAVRHLDMGHTIGTLKEEKRK